MKKLFKSFLKGDAGAVTAEFVVIVAAIGGISVVALAQLIPDDTQVNVDPDAALNKFVAGF